MKICSISDTQYNLPVIEEAVKIFNSAEAGIIHEGDRNPPCEACTSKGSLSFRLMEKEILPESESPVKSLLRRVKG